MATPQPLPTTAALIVHADVTVTACTEDEEPNGCRGRDLRHEGDSSGVGRGR
jgi:hypothetical protein